MAREKSEQEARAKEEQEKKDTETDKDEQGKAVTTATPAGEGSARNSIFNFGNANRGSSSGLGWGLSSWSEKAKSQVPSIKSTFGTAWGAPTFGSLGFGSAGGDSQLSPEELRLGDVGGRLARNSSSFFDDWYHAPTSADGHPVDASATDHAGDANTTHDPPHVLSDQAPSKAQSRVLSRVPTPEPAPTTIPTAENAETTTETLLKTDINPLDDLITSEKPTAPGTPTADDGMVPATSAGDATQPDTEEPPTATAEGEWSFPMKTKKGKKKTSGNSGVAIPNTDGTNEASGTGGKKKKKKPGK